MGSMVNALAILLGGGLGLLFRAGIAEKYRETIINGLGLTTVLIGLMGALQTQELLLLIASIVIGSIIGEWINIEGWLQRLGNYMEGKLKGGEGGVAAGFVTASLLFCVGSMAIVGSLQSGLTGNHETLFAKAILDGIMALFLASTLGPGVLLSAVPILLYEGGLTLGAAALKGLLTDPVVVELSAVGGLLVAAIGLNILEIKKIRVGNMLPAVVIPLVYFGIRMFW